MLTIVGEVGPILACCFSKDSLLCFSMDHFLSLNELIKNEMNMYNYNINIILWHTLQFIDVGFAVTTSSVC